MQHPAAIHRKRRYQVEYGEKQVRRSEPRQHRDAGIGELVHLRKAERAERRRQRERDHDIDRGARQRHRQLPRRRVGHALQRGDAADWQQRHLARRDSVAAGDQDVAELMRGDAGEQQQDEGQTLQRGHRAARAPGADADPEQQQPERDVDPDRHAGDATDRERPTHGEPSASVRDTTRAPRGGSYPPPARPAATLSPPWRVRKGLRRRGSLSTTSPARGSTAFRVKPRRRRLPCHVDIMHPAIKEGTGGLHQLLVRRPGGRGPL